MILQALTKLYEDLAERGEISPKGWGQVKVSYALCLNSDGDLTGVVPLLQEEVSGKKTVMRPQVFTLPARANRPPNFLWGNSGYILGIDNKPNDRSKDCFLACKKFHTDLLGNLDSPTACGIVRFFEKWNPDTARENPLLCEHLAKILMGANITFRVDGIFSHSDAAITQAWQSHYEKSGGTKMTCLVTGLYDYIEPLHPFICGIRNAHSSGAKLVSFDKPSFCSYGKEQGYNAPVGKYAAFAYTTALNHLIADRKNVNCIDDVTILCWADGAQKEYTEFACSALFGHFDEETTTESDIRATVKRLSDGLPCDDKHLDPNKPFYILALSPNSARLSVRFFLKNTFGNLMRNVNAHYERLEIVKPSFEKFDTIPLWSLLKETANPKSKDESASPVMSGATARAIFNGEPYPAALIQNVMLRIRAEKDITRGKAAIIKAYYLKNENKGCPKEVLTVSLNKESKNIPYTLGRLFCIYEAVQLKANPGINTTIKDKFFNSASSIPASIFPILDNLCMKHLRKLDTQTRDKYDHIICDIKGILGEEYPIRQTLPEQGSFNLGYYHQKQELFTKKEDKE